jgi:hypothetical protein
VLQTADVKVTNPVEFVTFVFIATAGRSAANPGTPWLRKDGWDFVGVRPPVRVRYIGRCYPTGFCVRPTFVGLAKSRCR